MFWILCLKNQKYIQAHNCLNNYLQFGIVPDDEKKKHKIYLKN